MYYARGINGKIRINIPYERMHRKIVNFKQNERKWKLSICLNDAFNMCVWQASVICTPNAFW